MDKLVAVNRVLDAMGVTPVTSVESTHPSVVLANAIIARVSREVQANGGSGWWFNSDAGLTLTPNADGEIILPGAAVSVDPVDTASQVILRGRRLYNRSTHTYIHTEPIKADVVWELPFDELPDTAAHYVMHKAAYDAVVGADGSLDTAKMISLDVLAAMRAIRAEHLRSLDVTLLNSPGVQRMRSGYRGVAAVAWNRSL